MSKKSIFEQECDKLQPILLEKGSALAKSEAIYMSRYAVKHFSFPYAAGYVVAYCDIFENVDKENESSKLKFFEAVTNIKKYKKCDLFFEGYCEAVAKIYDRTYEEVKDLISNKKYWLSYGSMK